MKAILPFQLTWSPMHKLALINFENDPDEVYRGLELQYLEGPPYGRGWRIIAYRNDNYVDVYDDTALTTIENERFDVAEKGLKHYRKTELQNVRFDKDKYGVQISFTFQDLLNRNVNVDIREHTKRKSKAMNLLAPVGHGSENPTAFPLFFLYEFDFVRRGKTKLQIEIDGKRRRPDNFPFPIAKDLQWRYYTRYSTDCNMLEFAKADENRLELVDLDENNTYTEGPISYYYNIDGKGISLSKITLNNKEHEFEMVFDQPLPLERKINGEMQGKFHIITDSFMGSVNGTYQWIQKNELCIIRITPDQGWTSVPNSFITKMILSPKSIFCTWPKSYHYVQEIRTNTLQSKSEWMKIN